MFDLAIIFNKGLKITILSLFISPPIALFRGLLRFLDRLGLAQTFMIYYMLFRNFDKISDAV